MEALADDYNESFRYADAAQTYDASGTSLSIRYYERFRREAPSWKRGENKSFGAGGLRRRAIYLQPKLDLAVGGKTVTLKRVPIFTTMMGSEYR